MDKATQNPLNTCVNCGAQTDYNFTSNSLKCTYCGSEYKLNQDARAKDEYDEDPTDNAGAIKFTRDVAEFKDKLLRWFTQGDQTPINLLFDGASSFFGEGYYPIYKFTGTYIGYYNTESKRGTILTQNNPLSGQFTVLSASGEVNNDITQLLDAKLIQNFDEKEIIPFSSLESPAELLAGNWNGGEVWEKKGKKAAADYVYTKLAQNGTGENVVYKHYLKYDLAKVSKVYMPIFVCVFSLADGKSVAYMDDKTGTLIGIPLIDNDIIPPSQKYLFIKYFLIGLGLWFGVLILRAALAAFINPHLKDEHYANNILFSPPAEKFWFIRGSFFLVIMPFVLSVLLYPLFVKRFFKKVQAIRDKTLDMVLTGKAQPRIFE